MSVSDFQTFQHIKLKLPQVPTSMAIYGRYFLSQKQLEAEVKSKD